LVDTGFAEFRSRLFPAAISPFILRAELEHPEDMATGPGMTSFFEPQLTGRSHAVVTLGSGGDPWSRLDELANTMRERRPDAHWIRPSLSSGRLDVFGADPATTMAFSWLQDGFLELKWLERHEYW
jgi:hypothetical protein